MFRVGDTETNSSSFLWQRQKHHHHRQNRIYPPLQVRGHCWKHQDVCGGRSCSRVVCGILWCFVSVNALFSNSISRLQVIRISFCFSFFLCEKNSSLFMVFNFVVNIFTNKLRHCHLFRRRSLHFVLLILNPIYCILPKWNGFPELSLTLSLMLCHFKVRMFN